MAGKRIKKKYFFLYPLIFIIIATIVFIGIQFFTKTGLFFVPGEINYDESLEDDEVTLLKEIFNDEIVLKDDVKISAYNTNEKLPLSENEILYSVKVPVTDFYDAREDISEFDDEEYEYIPLEELDNTKKLLTIDNEYYLDNFSKGAVYRILKFDSKSYEQEIKPHLTINQPVLLSKDSVLSFAQTGVTALSRGMNEKLYNNNDPLFFSSQLNSYLSGFDLTHTSNESSFSDYANSKNICSDWRFVETLTDIGLDIVELTGNHNQDCGDESAIETIDTYRENNIKIVGGGKTAGEASIPLEINEKGNSIAFFAFNQSTGGSTYDNTPGANQYYEDVAEKGISEAKEQGKFVIVDIQYFECNAYVAEYEKTTCDYANSSAGNQIGFFRHLIDLGADLVVGTSAHQPQTFELYNGGVIYYGLGNLFFDQAWWPGTSRSLVLEHYFYNNKLLQTRIQPTEFDHDLQPRLMDNTKKNWFINRLVEARP